MAFFGIPRGRRKAAPTIRITIDNINPSNNATLYSDSGVGTTVTFGTAAWLELAASLPQNVNYLEIFDSTGNTARLGLGAPASEADLLLDVPGGNGLIPVRIDAGSRVSLRAITTPAAGTEIVINFYD